MSIGPWNFGNAARWNQAHRLEAALDAAGWTGKQSSPQWQVEDAAKAYGAITFLRGNDADAELNTILAKRGLVKADWNDDLEELTAKLNLPTSDDGSKQHYYYSRPASSEEVDLSATPIFLDDLISSDVSENVEMGWAIQLKENALLVLHDNVELGRTDLTDWIARQDRSTEQITDAAISIPTPERDFVLLTALVWTDGLDEANITYLSGMLFGATVP
jgi:hypothetical protein